MMSIMGRLVNEAQVATDAPTPGAAFAFDEKEYRALVLLSRANALANATDARSSERWWADTARDDVLGPSTRSMARMKLQGVRKQRSKAKGHKEVRFSAKRMA